MTNYITSVGVQNVAITIPTGATSATATITAVGSYAFILNNGFQCTSANVTNVSYPRVELTNSTTVTAYRNTSSGTDTVTVYACVVDATNNLVASVQSGTITFASGDTSKTATINSTNASYTVVHYLGAITAQSSWSPNNVEIALTISGTTVTGTRQFSGSTETCGFIVIEFQGTACNQAVQTVNKAWTNSGTSTTATITSVNTNNAMLIWAGSNGNSSTSEAKISQYASLTNSTTITIQVTTAGSFACNYNCYVVEFATGVLSSSVQRGTTALTAATSNTSTISSVSSRAAMNFLRYISNQVVANLSNTACDAVLTNSTTVTIARNGSTGNSTGSWEIVEFGAFSASTTAAGTGGSISEFDISEAPISGSPSIKSGTLLPFPWMLTTGNMQDMTGGMRN